MRRAFAASVLTPFLCAGVLCPARVSADAVRCLTRVVPLGRIGCRAVSAIIILRDDEPALSVPVYSVSVRGCVGSGGARTFTDARDAWQTYYDAFRTGAYDFTGAGHRQIIVTTTMGQVWTEIYDIDDTLRGSPRLRVLYHRAGSRVVVCPCRNARGTYDLVENWSRRQWEDEENLGVGRYDPRTNYVRRLLHWDRRAKTFVPYRPGPSRIADTQHP
jgi:hypothetical protein